MRRDGTIIQGFTELQVERLTGVSVRRLRNWDRTGIFSPSLAEENRRLAYSRLYSFRDLVCLNVIACLVDDGGVPLKELRSVRKRLSKMGDDLWAKTTLYVLDRQVVFDNPETKQREQAATGQGVLKVRLKKVKRDIDKRVRLLWERDAEDFGKIEQHRNVAHNAPVLAGTRVPVRAIKAFAEAGYTTDAILREYPSLTAEDVAAALRYEAA